jgi:hypothetical protein
MMKPSPVYQTYARIAPRPQDFPVLLGKLGALGRSKSQLAILPGVSHYEMPTAPALATTVEHFLAQTGRG